MKSILFLIFPILFFASCSSNRNQTDDQELEKVYRMMQGSYDSSMQSKADSSYYNISLEMHPIWKKSGDKWLYVEQALASQKDQPYRVRMYKLFRKDENTIVSEVYTIPNEKAYYGKYKKPKAFQYLTPDYLELREGCEVLIHKDASGYYSGATGKTSCKSTMNGATYATSLLKFNEHQLISWDRGYDENGNQVWGAEKGGYIFNKGSLKNLELGDFEHEH